MMSDVILTRTLDDGNATFGTLHLAATPRPLCVTLENAWRVTEPGVSCMPEGEYELHRVHESPNDGVVPKVREVPGRSHILFHAGNRARDTLGCVLLGSGFGVIEGENAVVSSRAAFTSAVDVLRRTFPSGMCRLLVRGA